MAKEKKHSMKSVAGTSWWCGVLSMAAAMSLFQDIVGQEGCIELIKNMWMTPWISVPIAIVMLLWGLLAQAAALGHASDHDKK
jgi:hypothetical protein